MPKLAKNNSPKTRISQTTSLTTGILVDEEFDILYTEKNSIIKASTLASKTDKRLSEIFIMKN